MLNNIPRAEAKKGIFNSRQFENGMESIVKRQFNFKFSFCSQAIAMPSISIKSYKHKIVTSSFVLLQNPCLHILVRYFSKFQCKTNSVYCERANK